MDKILEQGNKDYYERSAMQPLEVKGYKTRDYQLRRAVFEYMYHEAELERKKNA